MISIQDLDQLIKREPRAGSPVLSVYLSTDASRQQNIQRGFEAVLHQMLRSIEGQLLEKPVRKQFAEDAGRVEHVVKIHVQREKSLAIFCDASEDFCWTRGLRIRLRDDAHWDDTPYLRPLLEALDEYERYGVVLIEHGRSPQTPAAVIRSGTTSDQESVIGTLADIVEKSILIEPPALIVIGDVVSLGDKLSWFAPMAEEHRFLYDSGHARESARV